MPVPMEGSVIENMWFLCISIKVSLLIKSSDYLQCAVNSISPLLLDPQQRKRRWRMATMTSEIASFFTVDANSILSWAN